MKALLITPERQSIEQVDISGRDDIVKMIGFETLESDKVGPDGDTLFFDEECFLRGTSGRFQIGNMIPVSGKGILIGTTDDGDTLRDVVSDIDSLQARIKYL